MMHELIIDWVIAMSPPPSQGGGQPQGPGMLLSFVIPMVFVGLIFYFVLIKPQKKQHQEVQKMRDSLEEGANVITTGGIHGVVKKVKDEIVTLQIADNVRIKINRGSIGKIKE
ncbi:MAG: preprotein translocase subunit YajC [Nitrospinota bacterium]|nr:preprotein translocase subunit YajC [Nitrospinota bacterium]